MRVLVSGSRKESLQTKMMVRRELDSLLEFHYPDLFLILGGAKGVDSYAQEWADQTRVNHIVLYADWDFYGKSAGAIRNRRMFDEQPDYVIAFPGPKSVGTNDVIRLANKKGIDYKITRVSV